MRDFVHNLFSENTSALEIGLFGVCLILYGIYYGVCAIIKRRKSKVC